MTLACEDDNSKLVEVVTVTVTVTVLLLPTHSLSFSFCPIVVSSFCLLFVHLSSFKSIFVQFDLSIFLFFTGRYWAVALDGLRSSFRSLKGDLDQS